MRKVANDRRVTALFLSLQNSGVTLEPFATFCRKSQTARESALLLETLEIGVLHESEQWLQKKTSKRCESETRFQKTCQIIRTPSSPTRGRCRWLRGLQDKYSLEDSVSLLVGPGFGQQLPLAFWRSEERRVGKECRSRWSPYH